MTKGGFLTALLKFKNQDKYYRRYIVMAGSIQKRGESFLLTVSSGKGLGGKRNRSTRTIPAIGKTEEKQYEYAQKQLVLFEAEVESGRVESGAKTTFKSFAEKYLQEYAEPELEKKTVHRYKEMLNSRIIPAIGHITLGDLERKPLILNEFKNNLREKGIRLDGKFKLKPGIEDILNSVNMSTSDLYKKAGVNPRTIKKIFGFYTTNKTTAVKISDALNINTSLIFDSLQTDKGLDEQTILHHHKLISSMLNKAIKWQLIKDNPAKYIDAPKVHKEEAKSYEYNHAIMLINALDDAPFKYKMLITLTIYTGVREGELMGLEWSDVDFKNNIITLRQASQYIPGEGTFTKERLKTTMSKREFFMPKLVMQLLEAYQSWQKVYSMKMKNKWIDSKRLFTQDNGLPMHPYTPTKWLPQFIKKCNAKVMANPAIPEKDKSKYLLPELNFHGLRHTNISLLIKAGIDIPTVSRWAGHSRKSTTLDTYSHSSKTIDKRPAEALEKVLAGPRREKRFTLRRI
jgi:integrase